ncbi:MAG TPA: O-antigen ligase family protein, partial [Candidatus Eisenbacteria bacterium]|nr:O-antigen ligase family protein [Candidatus Eisenbacteria bacterium]
LVPAATVARLESSGAQNAGGDLNGRVELWHAAFQAFQQHPFTGVGSAAFRETESNKVAHDLFFRLIAELGLVGLGLVAAIVLSAFMSGWRHPGALRGLWVSVLTGWVIGAAFYNLEDKKQTWVFLSLAVVNARLPAVDRTPRPAGVPEVPAARRETEALR